MATNNPHLKAIHGALSELRRAPMLEKARAAETVATLTLTLLTEFDRRLAHAELSIGELTNLADALAGKVVALERRSPLFSTEG